MKASHREYLRGIATDLDRIGATGRANELRYVIGQLSANPDETVGVNVGAEIARVENAARAIASELGKDFDKLFCLSMDPDVLTKDDMRRAAKAAVRAYVGVNVGVSAPQAEPAA
jgi:hypothetical protein